MFGQTTLKKAVKISYSTPLYINYLLLHLRLEGLAVQVLRLGRRARLVVVQLVHLLQVVHQFAHARIGATNAGGLQSGQEFAHRYEAGLLAGEHIEEHIFGIALLLFTVTARGNTPN